MFGDIKTFARNEPVATAAAALGVGVLLNLLPSRVVVGTLAAVGSMVIRPVLFSLGVAKAIELFSKSNSTQTHS